MATVPFGALLEAAIKLDRQGGVLTVLKDRIVAPRFFCCTLDTDGMDIIGVAKDPVAVLIVAPTRVCPGDNVNADYSHSWSSTSTIQSWIIDWGDGNSTSGVWLGPGNVNHPDGGYAIPATYTITLTVTDLLGATGEDTQQVEVIDCAAGPPLGLFAGCGSSGVWYSGDAGIGWETRGLEGVEIYDLKVHPFSLGYEECELWAATEDGLYKSINSGGSWTRIILPEPVGGHGTPSVAAITPSKIAAEEVFVACHGDVEDCATVWLYRTTDGGVTWTWVEVRACGTTAAAGYIESTVYGGHSRGKKFAVYGSRLYTLDVAENSFRIGIRNDATRTWAALGWPLGIRFEYGIIAGDGAPYRLWVCGGQSALAPGTHFQAWAGAGWVTFDGNRVAKYDLIRRPGGNIATTDYTAPSVRLFNGAGAYLAEHTIGNIPYGIYEFNGTLFVERWAVLPHIGRHLGGNNWTWETDSRGEGQFAEVGGILYTPSGATRLQVRDNTTQTWDWDSVAVPYITDHGAQGIDAICEHDGSIFVGTSRGRIYRREDTGYVLVGACSCDDDENDKIEIRHIINHGSEWLASVNYDINGTERRIYRLPGPTAALTVPAVGRTHIIDTDAYGQYVYLGLINEDGDPVIARVNSDLTGEGIHEIYRTNAGTWGGVKCDYTNGGRVWIYGDFGTTQVLLSDDFGDNFNVITGFWSPGEIIRPLLPSIYDSNDVVCWFAGGGPWWVCHTGDAGVTWAHVGDIGFACHCGERDWIEDQNIFGGAQVGVAGDHLEFSPNVGAGWVERSGGIVPNDAPITALQVVW